MGKTSIEWTDFSINPIRARNKSTGKPLLGPVVLPDSWLAGGDSAWTIVGGESGRDSRVCNVEWIRSIIRQCRAAKVPCFLKQVGSKPFIPGVIHLLLDRKGGDPEGWPDDLQVREFPTVRKGE